MIGGAEVDRTPLLVPSFSSKGFPEVKQILKTAEELIEGPMLISAYDIHYKHISPPFDFASLLFLDSGGYEASKDADLSDTGEREHIPARWSTDFHNQIASDWNAGVPTVMISYDHPKERLSITNQIERAAGLPRNSRIAREILLKPETEAQRFLQMTSVLSHVRRLADFDVIGITEKEAGNSILERMQNIARLRRALDAIGLETPIHVFGSLDTVSTVLYFTVGADIFDGLTWLRFAFKDGYTLYRQNYGALILGVGTKAHMLDARCWFNNYYYLNDLQLQMRRFLNDGDFGSFKYHSSTLREAYASNL